ncbi:MAG: hypothetical protein HC763_26455, partial [Hydrococcus sp. CRU_1_1]|nr:hypothetical protein [Hydrococcus sp. CRU_1_1]
SSRLMRKEYSAHLKQFYWSDKPMFWGGSYALITVGAQAPLENSSNTSRIRKNQNKK